MMGRSCNKNGLSRYIDKATKDYVRARCRFGCVLCGRVPYHYDHFRVPFSEAREHDPDDIILLCEEHHAHKTRGLLDNDVIQTAINTEASVRSGVRFKQPATKSTFKIHWPVIDIEAGNHTIVVDCPSSGFLGQSAV